MKKWLVDEGVALELVVVLHVHEMTLLALLWVITKLHSIRLPFWGCSIYPSSTIAQFWFALTYNPPLSLGCLIAWMTLGTNGLLFYCYLFCSWFWTEFCIILTTVMPLFYLYPKNDGYFYLWTYFFNFFRSEVELDSSL